MNRIRRELLGGTFLPLALWAPWQVSAQPPVPSRLAHIGVLTLYDDRPEPPGPPVDPFIRGMQELGYVQGKHFVTEVRRAAVGSQLERVAREMAESRAEVIVTAGPFAQPLKRVGARQPVVICGSPDPVGLGLVKSLAEPGTNFTGLSNQLVDLTAKRFEILSELFPPPARLGLLRFVGAQLDQAVGNNALRQLPREVVPVEVRPEASPSDMVAQVHRQGLAAVYVTGFDFLRIREALERAALQHRIGLMWGFRRTGHTDELVSYGPDFIAIWHRAAHYVDRILRGAAPGSLPMEQPTHFDLIINLRTAARLGVTVPPVLLARAARVIE